MKTSQNGRDLIESFEGLILQSYDDYNDHIVHIGDTVHGTLTIGYGHTNAAGPPRISIGDVFTKDQADAVLSDDLHKVEDQVSSLVKVPLNQNQFDALVSFEYNTGALGHSSALTLLNESKYSEAADHLLLYNQAGGRVLAGLVRRRQAEQKLFLTPISTQGQTQTMNPIVSILMNILGPTQIGGWVRAAVASGLTLLSTKYLPALAGIDVNSIIGDIAAGASTVVVGLWSSLSKTGTVYLPNVIKDIEAQFTTTAPVAPVVTSPAIPHETTH
jgi:lysozyme